LWDFHARTPIITFQSHTDNIIGIALSSDGKTLATTSFDKDIRIWRGFQAA